MKLINRRLLAQWRRRPLSGEQLQLYRKRGMCDVCLLLLLYVFHSIPFEWNSSKSGKRNTQQANERIRKRERDTREKGHTYKKNQIPRTRWPRAYDWMKRETWRKGKKKKKKRYAAMCVWLSVAYIPSGYIGSFIDSRSLSLFRNSPALARPPINNAQRRENNNNQPKRRNGQAAKRTSLFFFCWGERLLAYSTFITLINIAFSLCLFLVFCLFALQHRHIINNIFGWNRFRAIRSFLFLVFFFFFLYNWWGTFHSERHFVYIWMCVVHLCQNRWNRVGRSGILFFFLKQLLLYKLDLSMSNQTRNFTVV